MRFLIEQDGALLGELDVPTLRKRALAVGGDEDDEDAKEYWEGKDGEDAAHYLAQKELFRLHESHRLENAALHEEVMGIRIQKGGTVEQEQPDKLAQPVGDEPYYSNTGRPMRGSRR